MKTIFSRVFRLLTILQLRSKYLRHGIDLPKLSNSLGLEVESSLDLGSGPKPKNPFNAKKVFGADIRSYDINECVKKCSIGIESLPFDDNYFDVVTAFDLLEHIPRASMSGTKTIFPFIETMNEVWRVLQPDGLFYSQTPCYPMKVAFQDPTHVNIMTEDILSLYFGERAWARIYGFKGSFIVLMSAGKDHIIVVF